MKYPFIVEIPEFDPGFVADMRALRDAGDEVTLDRRIREWVDEHMIGKGRLESEIPA